MSSKIEISRELADLIEIVLSNGLRENTPILKEFREILAAPAVERQPVAWEYMMRPTWDKSPWTEFKWEKCPKENFEEYVKTPILHDWEYKVRELFTAPPELAELQALSVTNIMLDVVPGDGDGHEVYAKSVADVEAILTKQYDEIEELQATIARLTADLESERTLRRNHAVRIHELSDALKDGQGEPAPVSVVLPSAGDLQALVTKAARQADLTAGANYCNAAEFAVEALLDKVKELNP